MNLRGKIKQLLIHPILISLILSLVIYALVPIEIEKFRTELISQSPGDPNVNIYYFDLDGDGESEEINLIITPRIGLLVRFKGKVFEQWNFDRTFLGNPSMYEGMMFRDVDNNGISDIILTTYLNGSILMHCIDPLGGDIIFRDKKIAFYTTVNDIIKTDVQFIEAYDYNQDGLKEIYYALTTGHGIRPRSMHAYDFKNDTILSSPEGCNLFQHPRNVDIDLDRVPEFYAGSSAVGNCDIGDSYTDHYSWFMVFTPDMQFKFDPIKTGVYPSSFHVGLFDLEGQKLFAGLQINKGTGDLPCYIVLYDNSGTLIRKRDLTYSADLISKILLPQIKPNTIPVLKKDGTVFFHDSNLNAVDSLKISPLIGSLPISLDINQDGDEEYIFVSDHSAKLMITQNDFTSFTEIDLPERGTRLWISLKLLKGKTPVLFVNDDQFNCSYSYFSNPIYSFRHLLFPGFFLIVLGFISGLNKIQKVRLSRKYEAEKQLIELQLKSIKSQLDPHFTLNLLSSIGDLFDKKDKKTRRYIFGKYSSLLRHHILNADQFTVSLKSELEFIKNYLTLEKFRFDDKLDFEINQDGIDERIKIPKMLVHAFVENAVKHGIRPRGTGKIEISCESNGKTCITKVRDNGVGRPNSKDTAKSSTGQGLSITDRIIDNYEYLKNARIHYAINDLKDTKGNALGTEVEIHIPV